MVSGTTLRIQAKSRDELAIMQQRANATIEKCQHWAPGMFHPFRPDVPFAPTAPAEPTVPENDTAGHPTPSGRKTALLMSSRMTSAALFRKVATHFNATPYDTEVKISNRMWVHLPENVDISASAVISNGQRFW